MTPAQAVIAEARERGCQLHLLGEGVYVHFPESHRPDGLDFWRRWKAAGVPAICEALSAETMEVAA